MDTIDKELDELKEYLAPYGFVLHSIMGKQGEKLPEQFSFMNTSDKPYCCVIHLNKSLDKSNWEFEFICGTLRGALQLRSGRCSPVFDKEHFERRMHTFVEFATVLYDYEHNV